MSPGEPLPLHARALLDAARDCDDPTPEDRMRAAAAFAPKLAALGIVPALLAPTPLAAAPAVASAAAASGGFGLGAKLALVLVGVSVAGGGVVHLVRERDRARAPMHVVTRAQPRSSARDVTNGQATIVAPQALPVEAMTTDRPAVPAVAAVAQTSRAPRAALTAPRRAVRSPAPAATESTPVVAPEIAPEPANAAVIDDALREELALIARANTALRLEHPADALRALDEHAQRFEHGMLNEERRGLRVLALCALGPNQAALDARATFLRSAPNALLAPKVRAACSAEPNGARR
jgi:hypothetical protein